MTVGFVLIHCQNSYEDYVVEQLKNINSVQDIQRVSGFYDIVIKIKANDAKIITEIVYTQIRKIDKLNSTLTLMVSKPDGEE